MPHVTKTGRICPTIHHEDKNDHFLLSRLLYLQHSSALTRVPFQVTFTPTTAGQHEWAP